MILSTLKPIIRFATKELKERILFVGVDGNFSFFICSSFDPTSRVMEGIDVSELILGNNRDNGAWLRAKSDENTQRFKIYESNNVTVLDFLPS